MGAVKNLDDKGLHTLLASPQGPVLIDFHATWCGPCRSLSPNIEALAEEAGEALQVVKVDVDQSPVAASAFGVRSIPALFLVKDGEVQDVRLGLQSLPQLREWVSRLIA